MGGRGGGRWNGRRIFIAFGSFNSHNKQSSAGEGRGGERSNRDISRGPAETRRQINYYRLRQVLSRLFHGGREWSLLLVAMSSCAACCTNGRTDVWSSGWGWGWGGGLLQGPAPHTDKRESNAKPAQECFTDIETSQCFMVVRA